MITASPAPTFPGLVDLASASFDAAVLGCSDEFFAQACNLLSPKPAVFDPDRYTDHGKWMDGWESRRRRTVGEDWCVIRLGVRGELQAFDVDTSHFLGNHAPLARIEACDVPSGNSLESLDSLSHVEWIEVLEQAPLQAGSHNLFVVAPPRPTAASPACTHLER
jgi:allantoicase